MSSCTYDPVYQTDVSGCCDPNKKNIWYTDNCFDVNYPDECWQACMCNALDNVTTLVNDVSADLRTINIDIGQGVNIILQNNTNIERINKVIILIFIILVIIFVLVLYFAVRHTRKSSQIPKK